MEKNFAAGSFVCFIYLSPEIRRWLIARLPTEAGDRRARTHLTAAPAALRQISGSAPSRRRQADLFLAASRRLDFLQTSGSSAVAEWCVLGVHQSSPRAVVRFGKWDITVTDGRIGRLTTATQPLPKDGGLTTLRRAFD